ncbi:MAG: PatB family C-S lyase [Anaerolineaceae bacterium]|jgi:cystathionine beta-lyase|nr:PatB family C-S lyase [Anaerolineaceae bacterium]
MAYNFDQLHDRLNSDAIKWKYYDADVLPLWVADMDFQAPPAVIDALHRRVDAGIFGYPQEDPQLSQVVASRMAERYGWQIQPEDVLLAPGVVVGFNWVCHALAEPGEAVLIQPPVYPPFFGAPGNAGLVRQEAPLSIKPDGSYAIDFDAFERSIDANTRVFILCNPHNPVGRVFTPAELQRLAQICLDHNVWICSDEIHADLVFQGHPHTPIASLSPEIAHHTATLIAPSKTYNIPGLGCSFIIAQNPEIRNRLRSHQQGLVGHVNLLGQVGALAAYQHGDEWLAAMLAYLEANRDYLCTTVQQYMPEINMACPEGTYLAWLDCRQAGLAPNPYEFFLKEAKVALNDGSQFGTQGDGFVRLNFGCPRATLTEALERMYTALARRRPAPAE